MIHQFLGVIKLDYIIICILGWILAILANEIIDGEIKGERNSFPPSRIFQRHGISWMLRPVKKSVNRCNLFIHGKAEIRKAAVYGILIELSVIFTLLLIFNRYGSTREGLGAFLFIYGLIIISVVDLHTMRIPNRFNLILGGLHGIFVLLGWSVSLRQALLGALLGGGILFVINCISLIILRKEGMGVGDIKLAFAVGLYLGPAKVLFGLLIAVYIAGFILLILLLMRKVKRNQYIPYGPFLAGGFIISLLFFEDIMRLLWWL